MRHGNRLLSQNSCLLITGLVAGILAFCVSHAQAQVAMVNAASFRPEQPVAPGSWVAAFGTFQGVGTVQNTQLPLPPTLGGVTVRVDGVQAPLNFVSAGQINLLIPNEIASGLRTVEITTPTGTVNGSVRVIRTAPGIFTKDAGQPQRGAINNQDGSENGEFRPAIRGQVITIFATGAGPFNQTFDIGTAAPGNPPVLTQSTPQVFIGGVEASPVSFSGLTPTLAGLWQINVTVPNLSFLSGRLPVLVFMDGVDSNEVTVHVAQ